MDKADNQEIYLEMNRKQYELNVQLKQAIDRLADINHAIKDGLTLNNTKLDQNNSEIKEVRISFGNLEKYLLKIMFLLIVALIVLAGGKAVLEYVK